MAWQKGQSGNPRGSKPEKLIRDAIALALNEKVEVRDGDNNVQTVKKLRLVAQRVVDMAVEGDLGAIKEVADRMDGRPVQQVDMTVEEVTAQEATDAALNDIIAYHSRRSRNGTAKKANGSEEPDSVH